MTPALKSLTTVLVLLALLAGGLWYARSSGLRQGAAAAEERRLEQTLQTHTARRDTLVAQVRVADQHQARTDSTATVAQAHRVLAKPKVSVVAPDTLRVATDTGLVQLSVPVEVTTLLLADSVLISAQAAQIAARDTVITQLRATVAEDSVVSSLKDSIIVAVRQRPRGHLVAATATVTVVVLAALLHLFHR